MQGHTVLICYYLQSAISGFIPWSISSFIISLLDYRGRDSRLVVWHLHIQSIHSPLKILVLFSCMGGVLNTNLCKTICSWVAAYQWFSQSTPVSTSKTHGHDSNATLLKMADTHGMCICLWISKTHLMVITFIMSELSGRSCVGIWCRTTPPWQHCLMSPLCCRLNEEVKK